MRLRLQKGDQEQRVKLKSKLPWAFLMEIREQTDRKRGTEIEVRGGRGGGAEDAGPVRGGKGGG